MFLQNEPDHAYPDPHCPPLVRLMPAGEVDKGVVSGISVFHVICRDCGNVTRAESGGTVNDAPLAQANLYRQRHLAKHLRLLAAEIAEAAR